MWYVGFCYKCGKPVAFRKGQKTVLCRRCFNRLKCKKLLRAKHVKARSGNEAAVIIQRINEGNLDIP